MYLAFTALGCWIELTKSPKGLTSGKMSPTLRQIRIMYNVLAPRGAESRSES